ncbi:MULTISPECIES: hypothetical protein [unclassified Streptomyces]|uniref:hypothetical protein n=1 Tax=unclassified Streptomyces TaxID=2593676 RepID=UPI0036E228D1
MRMNSSMRPLWREPADLPRKDLPGEDLPGEDLPGEDLPGELRSLVDEGWEVGPAGSLLLRGMHGSGWRSDWTREEVSRHELDVNDVWIPPTGLDESRDVFLPGLVARAREFLSCAMKSAHGLESADLLVGIISIGVDDDFLDHGATVKLSTRRGGFPDYYDDLERFQFEGMAVVEAADMPGR